MFKSHWFIITIVTAAVTAGSFTKFENLEENYLDEEEFALAANQSEREGKLLFPFISIVRFANTECASSSAMTGTCLARRECNNLNGTSTGYCASRRGSSKRPIAYPVGLHLPSYGFQKCSRPALIQLGCDCPGIAPNGCLQYYTGTSGTINSFNYGTAANTALSTSQVTGTRQIVNLNYGICIRMEAGYCAIQYAQTSNEYSFTVTGDVEGADDTVLGTDVGAENDGDCTTDFVVIPNPYEVSNGDAIDTDRFCGIGFVTVQTGAKPFVLYVVTDGSEGATASTSPDVANRGFSLTYTQVAC
ncbi:hypothetical protein K1T71_000212 [Dendrolimus kikuchii]|uniref:Uncharacterized protein n=1 Tax=Dendrolimus kikuchii TaxID=765133 RepID=A0ACC1DJ86_9NEOP|nr:hypothetical protein K1T71_000212 [Dendrolimus kikuchii]